MGKHKKQQQQQHTKKTTNANPDASSSSTSVDYDSKSDNRKGGKKGGKHHHGNNGRRSEGSDGWSDMNDDEAGRVLKHQLDQLGLRLKDMTGDGNCLFRSLSDQVSWLGDGFQTDCYSQALIEPIVLP
jgi:hypothetical protein